MEIRKKISVIIPVYNAEKYVSNILEDLREQTYNNMQIIVIDDGSIDNSIRIVKRQMKLDKRIELITSNNNGPSKARNIGLQHAEGEFIRFIDADDRIPKDSMEKMISPYTKDEEIDLVIGNYICAKEKNYFTGDNSQKGKVSDKELSEMFVKHVKSFYYGVPWNKLYKKSIIEKNRIRFDESLCWCEDFLFNIEYYGYSKCFYFIYEDNGVYEYCSRDTGITENLSVLPKDELERIDEIRFENAINYFKKYDLDEVCRLEWKYSGIYYKLSNIASKKSGESLKERYEKFYLLLSDKEVYQYITFMKKESGLAIWKWLEVAAKHRKYRLAFWVFVVKEYIASFINSKNFFMRKNIKDKIPKFL